MGPYYAIDQFCLTPTKSKSSVKTHTEQLIQHLISKYGFLLLFTPARVSTTAPSILPLKGSESFKKLLFDKKKKKKKIKIFPEKRINLIFFDVASLKSPQERDTTAVLKILCQQISVKNFQGNSNINHLLWIGCHHAWNWIYLI